MKERPNYFAKEDKLQFLKIINKYRDFFENRDTSQYNVKGSKDMWTLIENDYNALNSKTGPRTAYQLQNLFKTLKRKARRDAKREETFYLGSDNAAPVPVVVIESAAMDITNTSEDIQMDQDFIRIAHKYKNAQELKSNEIDHQYFLIPHEEEQEEAPPVEQEAAVECPQSPIECPSSLVECTQEEYLREESSPVPQQRKSRFNGSLNRRFLEEQFKLKMKILRVELEAKKQEASMNKEIQQIQKDVALINKEETILRKRAKEDEMLSTKQLMLLQIENERLKQKLLQIQLQNAR